MMKQNVIYFIAAVFFASFSVALVFSGFDPTGAGASFSAIASIGFFVAAGVN